MIWTNECSTTDRPPGGAVPQEVAQDGGGEDDQPGHQAAPAQPEVVQLGPEDRESSVTAKEGEEEGGQDQDLQLSSEQTQSPAAWVDILTKNPYSAEVPEMRKI